MINHCSYFLFFFFFPALTSQSPCLHFWGSWHWHLTWSHSTSLWSCDPFSCWGETGGLGGAGPESRWGRKQPGLFSINPVGDRAPYQERARIALWVCDHGKRELLGVMRLARVIKMNDNKNLGWDMKPRALELKLISNRDQGIYRGQIILCLPSWGSYTSSKLSDAVQRKALLSGWDSLSQFNNFHWITRNYSFQRMLLSRVKYNPALTASHTLSKTGACNLSAAQ